MQTTGRLLSGTGAALLLGAALVALPAPAYAVDVADYAALQAAFADPSSVGNSVTVTQAVAQGGTDADLVLSAGQELTVDLAGDLTTRSIVLEQGATLNVTSATQSTLSATASTEISAGIHTSAATATFAGDVVVESRAIGGAAIGGDTGEPGGNVEIRESANVTATTELGGAAIGGGGSKYVDGVISRAGDGGPVTIEGDAVVTAISGFGAGIGGGGGDPAVGEIPAADGGDGAAVAISGNAEVYVESRDGGAGIGGGDHGSGGDVVIGASATVTAVISGLGDGTSAASAIGQGRSISTTDLESFGTLAIEAGGVLILPTVNGVPSSLVVPSGSFVTGDGEIRGDGRIANYGSIQLLSNNVDWSEDGLFVSPHNSLVNFDENGGTVPAEPVEERVLAGDFLDGARVFPTPPEWPGHAFLGWNTRPDGTGLTFTETSSIRVAAGEEEILPPCEALPTPDTCGGPPPVPVDLTVYAQWEPAPTPTPTPSPTPGPVPPSPTPGPTPAGGGSTHLPATGFDGGALGLGGIALLAGAALLIGGAMRRRRGEA